MQEPRVPAVQQGKWAPRRHQPEKVWPADSADTSGRRTGRGTCRTTVSPADTTLIILLVYYPLPPPYNCFTALFWSGYYRNRMILVRWIECIWIFTLFYVSELVGQHLTRRVRIYSVTETGNIAKNTYPWLNNTIYAFFSPISQCYTGDDVEPDNQAGSTLCCVMSDSAVVGTV